tara:strand:- start:694 stop:2028 length:1335 start_codon:yes stop_codon:yes gene_type:complete
MGGRCCPTALRCVAERLRTGSGPVVIEAFGTSVTQGHLHHEGLAYPALLHRSIARHWPSAKHTVANRGKSGASIEYLSACVDRMLPRRDADLYLLETTDNYGFTTSADARRHFEEIVDSVLTRRPGVAIIIIAPFAVSCSRRLMGRRQFKGLGNDSSTMRDHLTQCFANDSLPSVLEQLADDRGLPIVSTRNGLRAELQADGESTLLRYIKQDLVHPTVAGHAMLAEGVLQVLRSALRKSADPNSAGMLDCAVSSKAERLALETAPAAGRALCAFGEALHPLVRRAHGWSYVVERSSQGQPKPGYIATTPGATIEVCHLHGENIWQFGYLRSYVGMGVARAECVSGCKCPPREWNAHRPKAQVSQTAISKLQKIRILRGKGVPGESWVGCRCVIRMTLTNQTTSAGHKFKLEALFGAFRMYNTNYAVCGEKLCAYKAENESRVS